MYGLFGTIVENAMRGRVEQLVADYLLKIDLSA